MGNQFKLMQCSNKESAIKKALAKVKIKNHNLKKNG